MEAGSLNNFSQLLERISFSVSSPLRLRKVENICVILSAKRYVFCFVPTSTKYLWPLLLFLNILN